jgi:hypothetical protein
MTDAAETKDILVLAARNLRAALDFGSVGVCHAELFGRVRQVGVLETQIQSFSRNKFCINNKTKGCQRFCGH